MSCTVFEKHLPQYVGNELSAWKKVVVQRHLAGCAHCRDEHKKYVRALELAVDEVRQQSLRSNESEIWNGVLFHLRDVRAPSTRKTRPWRHSFKHRLVPALAAIAMALTLLFVRDRARIAVEPAARVAARTYAVVEHVPKENITVLTFATDDPDVTVVWFFEE